MVAAQCTDNLRFLPYWDGITNCLLAASHYQWEMLLGLRGHYTRTYFKCLRQCESHHAAVLNILMFIYVSYAVSVF